MKSQLRYFEILFVDIVDGERQYTTVIISGSDYDSAWIEAGYTDHDRYRVMGIMQLNPDMI